uniref:Uncharacterized protein n=1 Tax=Ixodes ricinus TaxID=34613 RepID=A0A6B0V4S2_IXORI
MSFRFPSTMSVLPMLTSLMLSWAMALSAVWTFSRHWCWLRGFLMRLSFRFWSTSTSEMSLRPSLKSTRRSETARPCGRSCSFTQLVNVFSWISTQTHSSPRICMALAACPSGERAFMPIWLKPPSTVGVVPTAAPLAYSIAAASAAGLRRGAAAARPRIHSPSRGYPGSRVKPKNTPRTQHFGTGTSVKDHTGATSSSVERWRRRRRRRLRRFGERSFGPRRKMKEEKKEAKKERLIFFLFCLLLVARKIRSPPPPLVW